MILSGVAFTRGGTRPRPRPLPAHEPRLAGMSAMGQLETIQPNSRRGRFIPNGGLDGSPQLHGCKVPEAITSSLIFQGRLLMDVLPAPTTTNIALSNGRSRSPRLLVSTCSAHASSARARSSAKS